MKILYLHQYFRIPTQSGGTRSFWIALELIKKGHSVTLITSRENQANLIEKELINGINVVFIKNAYSNKMSASRRLISFFNFMLISSYVALIQKEINLVYATSTPLSIGVPALLLRYFKRVQFFFEVRDLWPEFPIQVGVIKSSILQRFLRKYEKLIYKKALHIIALSPGMKDGILKTGVDHYKITVIPNMSKIDKFFPREPDLDICTKFGFSKDKFKIIHFGAMGYANGLEYLINAAKIFKDRHYNDIQIILLGDGMIKEYLHKLVVKNNLRDWIVFIDKQPMNITSEIVNICDCSVVTFIDLPVLQTNSPNKLFDSLSAGKPVIVNSRGWTKEIVENNQCGFFVNPNEPEEFVNSIMTLKNDKKLALKMGNNSRILAEQKFDKSILCEKLVQIIENIYQKHERV